MARRFLPAVFCIPILLGWLGLRGMKLGSFGTELGFVLYSTTNTIVFTVLVWLNARKLNVESSQRGAAEAALRQLNAELKRELPIAQRFWSSRLPSLPSKTALLDLAPDAIIVRDMQRRILFWNRGAEVLYGWLRQDALGKNMGDLLRSRNSLSPSRRWKPSFCFMASGWGS